MYGRIHTQIHIQDCTREKINSFACLLETNVTFSFKK